MVKLVLERANARLFNDVEYYKSGSSGGSSSDKLRLENDKLRDMFKRAEVGWLKERQALLNEIDLLRDRPEPGYRTVRPERDIPDQKEAKVCSE